MTDTEKNIGVVGELLREARVTQNLCIDDIAREICVRSSYLRDIEAGHYDRLPEATFAVGFVCAYAKAVKLDAVAVVAAFKDECRQQAKAEETVQSQTEVETPRRRIPGWLSPVAGLMGVSLCWFVLEGSLPGLGMSAENGDSFDVVADQAQLAAARAALADTSGLTVDQQMPSVASATEIPVETTAFVAPTSLFLPAAQADITPVRAKMADSVICLEATEDSWLRLANEDGTEVWAGVLRAGQTYRPDYDGVVYLSTSNAGGLNLTVGAGTKNSLGDRGEIINGLKIEDPMILSATRGRMSGLTGSR